jgi:hypothetical protein
MVGARQRLRPVKALRDVCGTAGAPCAGATATTALVEFRAKSTIATNANGAFSVFAIDVNGDGHIDVLSASNTDDTIAWYENDGSTPPGWTKRTIATDADSARSVFAIDVNGDGHIDVLSASYTDDTIAWYKNNGSNPPMVDQAHHRHKMPRVRNPVFCNRRETATATFELGLLLFYA